MDQEELDELIDTLVLAAYQEDPADVDQLTLEVKEAIDDLYSRIGILQAKLALNGGEVFAKS